MKSLSFFILIFLFGSWNPLTAQNDLSPWEALSSNVVQMTDIEQEAGPGKTKVFIEMPYGSSAPMKIDDPKALKNGTIESVELVYTAFTRTPTFAQQQLNKSRLEALLRKYPNWKHDDFAGWRCIELVQAGSFEEARSKFHGFIVTMRVPATAASMEEEVAYLEKIMAGADPASALPAKKKIALDAVSSEDSFVALDDTTEPMMTHWETNYPVGKMDPPAMPVAVSTRLDLMKIDTLGDRVYLEWTNLESLAFPMYHLESATFGMVSSSENAWSPTPVVTEVLNRNKNWKTMMVVVDVTGSMSPYTSQLFTWMKLNDNLNRTQHFVFFNDGDNTMDNKKITGKVGGIYQSEAKSFEEVMQLAFKAMRNGGGGDAPENNVEAVIKGISTSPDCKDIVMIADNFCTPRDLAFLNKVDRPIHVVLCGTSFGVNIQYMNMALLTGGTIHTIEQDIDNLKALNEGETITVEGQVFKIENGKFVHLRKT